MTAAKQPDGLQRLLDFLAVLDAKSIDFRLDRHAPDCVTVTFGVVGARIEAYFETESMYYSVFRGDEAVEADIAALMQLIEQRSA